VQCCGPVESLPFCCNRMPLHICSLSYCCAKVSLTDSMRGSFAKHTRHRTHPVRLECVEAGTGPAAALEKPLWELFRRPFDDESTAWLAAREVAARGDEFIVRACRVAGEPELGTFSLQFRYMSAGPSCSACAQPGSLSVGSRLLTVLRRRHRPPLRRCRVVHSAP